MEKEKYEKMVDAITVALLITAMAILLLYLYKVW